MNLKQALEYAASKNVKAVQTSSARSQKSYTVGSHTVEWRSEFGGKACYRVDGERAGYAAEAIVKAVDLELAAKV